MTSLRKKISKWIIGSSDESNVSITQSVSTDSSLDIKRKSQDSGYSTAKSSKCHSFVTSGNEVPSKTTPRKLHTALSTTFTYLAETVRSGTALIYEAPVPREGSLPYESYLERQTPKKNVKHRPSIFSSMRRRNRTPTAGEPMLTDLLFDEDNTRRIVDDEAPTLNDVVIPDPELHRERTNIIEAIAVSTDHKPPRSTQQWPKPVSFAVDRFLPTEAPVRHALLLRPDSPYKDDTFPNLVGECPTGIHPKVVVGPLSPADLFENPVDDAKSYYMKLGINPRHTVSNSSPESLMGYRLPQSNATAVTDGSNHLFHETEMSHGTLPDGYAADAESSENESPIMGSRAVWEQKCMNRRQRYDALSPNKIDQTITYEGHKPDLDFEGILDQDHRIQNQQPDTLPSTICYAVEAIDSKSGDNFDSGDECSELVPEKISLPETPETTQAGHDRSSNSNSLAEFTKTSDVYEDFPPTPTLSPLSDASNLSASFLMSALHIEHARVESGSAISDHNYSDRAASTEESPSIPRPFPGLRVRSWSTSAEADIDEATPTYDYLEVHSYVTGHTFPEDYTSSAHAPPVHLSSAEWDLRILAANKSQDSSKWTADLALLPKERLAKDCTSTTESAMAEQIPTIQSTPDASVMPLSTDKDTEEVPEISPSGGKLLNPVSEPEFSVAHFSPMLQDTTQYAGHELNPEGPIKDESLCNSPISGGRRCACLAHKKEAITPTATPNRTKLKRSTKKVGRPKTGVNPVVKQMDTSAKSSAAGEELVESTAAANRTIFLRIRGGGDAEILKPTQPGAENNSVPSANPIVEAVGQDRDDLERVDHNAEILESNQPESENDNLPSANAKGKARAYPVVEAVRQGLDMFGRLDGDAKIPDSSQPEPENDNVPSAKAKGKQRAYPVVEAIGRDRDKLGRVDGNCVGTCTSWTRCKVCWPPTRDAPNSEVHKGG